MIARTLVPGTTAASVASLLDMGKHADWARAIILQAPSGNTLAINYGSKSEQPFTLAAGATSPVILVNSLEDFYVLGGDADDEVLVLITRK